MKSKSLYLAYASTIAVLGVVGFLLTHAKSALISGLASAVVIAALAFFVEKSGIASIAAKVVNVLLLGVFSWRSTLAITAVLNEHPEKLIPSVLLVLMAMVSLGALVASFMIKE